jgi:methylmalonyl-CoA mutase C-terminal domain/subunit
MKEKEVDDILLTGGGIIPDEDKEQLERQGVDKVFPPGTTTQDIVDYIQEWVRTHREF